MSRNASSNLEVTMSAFWEAKSVPMAVTCFWRYNFLSNVKVLRSRMKAIRLRIVSGKT